METNESGEYLPSQRRSNKQMTDCWPAITDFSENATY